jgi:phospholipase C
MDTSDRRSFLKLIGSSAIAAALPLDLSKVLAIQANNRTGTIADVEHIVILMQENRSFDHYFGTMRGVRGFSDPRAVTLPSGQSVWAQPNGSGVLLPYRPDVQDLGMTFLPDPPHGWRSHRHRPNHAPRGDRRSRSPTRSLPATPTTRLARTGWACACRCSWFLRGAGADGSTRSCSTTPH